MKQSNKVITAAAAIAAAAGLAIAGASLASAESTARPRPPARTAACRARPGEPPGGMARRRAGAGPEQGQPPRRDAADRHGQGQGHRGGEGQGAGCHDRAGRDRRRGRLRGPHGPCRRDAHHRPGRQGASRSPRSRPAARAADGHGGHGGGQGPTEDQTGAAAQPAPVGRAGQHRRDRATAEGTQQHLTPEPAACRSPTHGPSLAESPPRRGAASGRQLGGRAAIRSSSRRRAAASIGPPRAARASAMSSAVGHVLVAAVLELGLHVPDRQPQPADPGQLATVALHRRGRPAAAPTPAGSKCASCRVSRSAFASGSSTTSTSTRACTVA